MGNNKCIAQRVSQDFFLAGKTLFSSLRVQMGWWAAIKKLKMWPKYFSEIFSANIVFIMFSTFSYFAASFPEFWYDCYSLLVTYLSFFPALFIYLCLFPPSSLFHSLSFCLSLSFSLSPHPRRSLFLSHLFILLISFIFCLLSPFLLLSLLLSPYVFQFQSHFLSFFSLALSLPLPHFL